ncbi:MAG: EamA family transporter [Chloroflexi bacterium]|nr:EamA family transporter [Chloroflexota bacterium]
MDWLFVALASAFAFAIVSVLDKIIFQRFIPRAATFIFLVGVVQIVMGLVIMLFSPLHGYPFQVWGVAYLSGMLWGVSLATMFWVMSYRDVSRVIPVVSSSPVFVAILAVVFLSERLTALHWLAIAVTVAGAAFISQKGSEQRRSFPLDSSFFLLMLGSATFALGIFLSKFLLQEMEFWDLLILRNFGLGTTCLLLMTRPSVLRDALRVFKSPAATGIFVMTEGVFAFVGMALVLWAIDLGPVSLVATVMSARPMIVLALSILFSMRFWRLLDEPLDRKTLTNKLVSTAMIVAGISAIALL